LHSKNVSFSVIAEKLKKTDRGVAEFFQEASVYFSDIVGFTKLAAESRPMEVVDLLNDLYGALDAVISRHDVYKVFHINPVARSAVLMCPLKG